MGSVFIVGHHRWLHTFSLWYSQICFTNSFFRNLAVDKCLTLFYLSYKECLTCINQRLGGFFFKQGWYLLNKRINNCYLFSNIPRNWLSCRAVGDIITRREVNINAIEECNCYHHHHSCRSLFPVWRLWGYPPCNHPDFPLCGYLPTYMSHKSSCQYISGN